ncbi:MAG: hypothetical protein U0736_09035 [Gemmataceae bacterium]
MGAAGRGWDRRVREAAALAERVPTAEVLHLARLKDEGLLFYYDPTGRPAGAASERGGRGPTGRLVSADPRRVGGLAVRRRRGGAGTPARRAGTAAGACLSRVRGTPCAIGSTC